MLTIPSFVDLLSFDSSRRLEMGKIVQILQIAILRQDWNRCDFMLAFGKTTCRFTGAHLAHG
jgi:hypothetical protein